MKPRTILQKRVVSLADKLKPIDDNHIKFCKEKVFKFYYYRTKTKQTCLQCNTSWKIKDIPLKQCPNCHRKISSIPKKIIRSYDFKRTSCINKRTNTQINYVMVFETYEEFQVIRHIYVERKLKVGQQPIYLVQEVFQLWIAKHKKITVYSMNYNAFGWNQQCAWCFDGKGFSIKHDNNRFHIYAKIYPKKKILPELKRNGFKGSLHGFLPSYLMQSLLENPYVETLFKAKYYELANSKINNIKLFWSSIKKAMRNKYVPSDYQLWLDYLSMQRYLGKDMLNDKYIFPKDVEAAHDKANRDLNIRRAKKDAARVKDEIEKANIFYVLEKEKYFNVLISNEHYSISTLKSVQEFYEEGIELGHCVFNNKYYENKNSLILSVKQNEERVATVEINLKYKIIDQIRGLKNDKPKGYEEIYGLVEQNISQITSI